MTNRELIAKHNVDTMFCSFSHHMRSSSSTYNEIINKGEEIIADILKYMQESKEHGNMSIILLLMDITQESPYSPEILKDKDGNRVYGFVGFDVEETVKAWINWGREKKFI